MRVFRTRGDTVALLGLGHDGRLLVGYDRLGLHLIDPAGRGQPRTIRERSPDGLGLNTRRVRFTADGRATWHDRRGLVQLDPVTLKTDALSLPREVSGFVHGFDRTGDGTRLVTLCAKSVPLVTGWQRRGERWARVWEHGGDTAVACPPTGDRVAHLFTDVSDGKWSALGKPTVVLRDWDSGERIASAACPFAGVGELTFRPDGGQLLYWNGGEDLSPRSKRLLVCDLAEPLTGPLRSAALTFQRVVDLAYHPSGHFLFVAGTDRKVSVWDTGSWQRVTRFDWGIGPLTRLAVSPDGALAAAGGEDGSVVVWDVDM